MLRGIMRKGNSMTSASKKGALENSAFMRPLTPSPELAAVVGSEPIPRTEVTKRIWKYIKKHDLQDLEDRRMINADENLRPVFGTDQVSMFEMQKLVGKHLS